MPYCEGCRIHEVLQHTAVVVVLCTVGCLAWRIHCALAIGHYVTDAICSNKMQVFDALWTHCAQASVSYNAPKHADWGDSMLKLPLVACSGAAQFTYPCAAVHPGPGGVSEGEQ